MDTSLKGQYEICDNRGYGCQRKNSFQDNFFFSGQQAVYLISDLGQSVVVISVIVGVIGSCRIIHRSIINGAMAGFV